MTIFVVRHGQTDWNIEGKLQGRIDTSLNQEGMKQAEKVRELLKDKLIDYIIYSPLKRARQTAEIINQDRGLSIIYDDRILERDLGEFEGKLVKEFNFSQFNNHKANIYYEKAENVRDFFDRIYGFLEKITKKYKGKNILIITHGGVSIPINCYFNHIPPANKRLTQML